MGFERRLAPSILSADFVAIAQALDTIGASGAPMVHCDVMDGHFVPPLTFGPQMIGDIRRRTRMHLDVHLMISNPEVRADAYLEAGADTLTFHLEACVHPLMLLSRIRQAGRRCGISLVPSTPLAMLEEVLPFVDHVLLMTVNPGFGGQQMLPGSLERIQSLAATRTKRKLGFTIGADGGINTDNLLSVARAGADILVTGNAFFNSPDPASLVRLLAEG